MDKECTIFKIIIDKTWQKLEECVKHQPLHFCQNQQMEYWIADAKYNEKCHYK